MAKKIYDILPPKLEEKIEDAVKVLTGASGKKKHRKTAGKSKKSNSFPWKNVFWGAGILVFIIFGFLYFKLQRADIEIWPKTEILSFSQKIIADKGAGIIDNEKNTIPAQVFEENKDLSKVFSATGVYKQGSKATASIRIYNKYSPAFPLALKAGTHFLSDSGKYFICPQKIVVPSAKMINGKLTAGYIDIKAQAEEAGEDYNISSAKFSVPKLVGTPYYYSIYGELLGSASGGFSKDVKQITAQDMQNAKDITAKELLDSAENSLKQKVSQDYVLLNNAISKNIIESSSGAKVGDIADNFSYQAKAKLLAVAFKKSDIEKLAKDYILKNMQEEKITVEGSFVQSYSADLVDISSGKITLNSDFSAKIYRKLNVDDIMAMSRGKNEKEIKEIIRNNFQDRVDKIEARLWPFWTTKVPTDKNKIEAKLKFQ